MLKEKLKQNSTSIRISFETKTKLNELLLHRALETKDLKFSFDKLIQQLLDNKECRGNE